MRIVTGLVAVVWLAGTGVVAPATSADQKSRAARFQELWELEVRAAQLYPRRRDSPLRDLNMTDDEVREIQVIAGKYHMPELINISPVVTGCPCEEGGACTEQVYITGRYGGGTVGMQLSRKKNLWTVGVVQKWWLEYAALKAREGLMARAEFLKARANLLLALPICSEPAKSRT